MLKANIPDDKQGLSGSNKKRPYGVLALCAPTTQWIIPRLIPLLAYLQWLPLSLSLLPMPRPVDRASRVRRRRQLNLLLGSVAVIKPVLFILDRTNLFTWLTLSVSSIYLEPKPGRLSAKSITTSFMGWQCVPGGACVSRILLGSRATVLLRINYEPNEQTIKCSNELTSLRELSTLGRPC